MTIRRLRPSLLAAALILPFLASCGQEQAPAPPLPQVAVAHPLTKSITEWDEFSGRFEAVNYVEVRSRVSGYLQSIHFKDGEIVNKGDLLFVIDPRPFQVELDRARAELKDAQARYSFAASNVERARKLLSNQTVSQQVYDQRVQERDQARAAVERAEAAVREAQLNLSYTRITAPISGRISARVVSTGNLVTGGAGDSTLLTSIASLDPIHFVFDGDEAVYLKYVRTAADGKQGERPATNPVELQLMGENGFPHKGTMDFLDNQIDPQTGTIRGRAIVPNPKHVFVPGMFAKMRLIGSTTYEAALIPEQALATDQTDRIVFVVGADGKVAPRKVTLGPLIDGMRAVREGLKPTDQVVVDGLMRVRPGAQVQPKLIALNEGGGTATASTAAVKTAMASNAPTGAAQ